ncbi:MAG: nitroreductase family protein [Eubacterium sp.]|nr:nitroreductase family protein [Eubacterium sp.]
MELREAIEKRFSCRRFADKPVEEEKIQEIIRLATYAPNGKNTQKWHFTIVESEEGKEKLRQAAGDPPEDFGKEMKDVPGYGKVKLKWPFQGDFCGAPIVIMISGDPNVPWPDIGPRLAAENLMLAATDLGLATLWSTLFTKDLFRDEKTLKLKEYFLPEGYELYATLFVGYPEKQPAKRPERKGDIISWR